MTATNNLTNITRAEAADSGSWGNTGSGGGSGQDDGSPIDGLENRSRRIDNKKAGFGFITASAIDISGSGVHVGYWTGCFQPGSISTTGIEHGFSDTATDHRSGNWDAHRFNGADFPAENKFLRIWVDPNRTREDGAGTLSLSSVRCIGADFDMANVGGAANNCHLDRMDYGSLGITITGGTLGTPETFASAVSLDSANALGVFNGDTINAPVKIGGAATVFRDSNFSIKASNQPLAEVGFPRLELDASNGAEDVLIDFGFLSGVHLTFVGTSATQADLGGLILSGAPLAITMTAAWSWGGALINSPTLNQGGANLDGMVVDASTSATAVVRSATGTYVGGEIKNNDRGSDVTALIDGNDEVTIDGTVFSGNTVDITLNHAVDVQVNLINGASASTVENTGAGNATINNPVTVTVEGLVVGKPVYLQRTDTNEVLLDKIAASTSESFGFNYPGFDVPYVIRHRVSSSGDTKKKRYTNTGLIRSSGETHTVNLNDDTLAT